MPLFLRPPAAPRGPLPRAPFWGAGGIAGRPHLAATTLSHAGAVVAHIPLGGVVSLVADGARAWVVRRTEPGAISALSSYQLAGIDLRTSKVTVRVSLGRHPEAVAAGGGMVWLTTPGGRARGQVERLDPATGRVIATLRLPANRCTGLA